MSFLSGLFKKKTRPVIIVSGLPRSGTSMMMKMLEAGGIHPLTDGERSADSDNPEGYYEFERVKKLPDGDYAWLSEAQGKSVKVISALLRHLPSDYQYQILFMQRALPEVLASQKKMLTNRGETEEATSDDEMAQLYEKHLAMMFRWVQSQPNIALLAVDYNGMLADPQPQVEAISRFLGGGIDVEKMVGVVNPELYRQRKKL